MKRLGINILLVLYALFATCSARLFCADESSSKHKTTDESQKTGLSIEFADGVVSALLEGPRDKLLKEVETLQGVLEDPKAESALTSLAFKAAEKKTEELRALAEQFKQAGEADQAEQLQRVAAELEEISRAKKEKKEEKKEAPKVQLKLPNGADPSSGQSAESPKTPGPKDAQSTARNSRGQTVSATVLPAGSATKQKPPEESKPKSVEFGGKAVNIHFLGNSEKEFNEGSPLFLVSVDSGPQTLSEFSLNSKSDKRPPTYLALPASEVLSLENQLGENSRSLNLTETRNGLFADTIKELPGINDQTVEGVRKYNELGPDEKRKLREDAREFLSTTADRSAIGSRPDLAVARDALARFVLDQDRKDVESLIAKVPALETGLKAEVVSPLNTSGSLQVGELQSRLRAITEANKKAVANATGSGVAVDEVVSQLERDTHQKLPPSITTRVLTRLNKDDFADLKTIGANGTLPTQADDYRSTMTGIVLDPSRSRVSDLFQKTNQDTFSQHEQQRDPINRALHSAQEGKAEEFWSALTERDRITAEKLKAMPQAEREALRLDYETEREKILHRALEDRIGALMTREKGAIGDEAMKRFREDPFVREISRAMGLSETQLSQKLVTQQKTNAVAIEQTAAVIERDRAVSGLEKRLNEALTAAKTDEERAKIRSSFDPEFERLGLVGSSQRFKEQVAAERVEKLKAVEAQAEAPAREARSALEQEQERNQARQAALEDLKENPELAANPSFTQKFSGLFGFGPELDSHGRLRVDSEKLTHLPWEVQTQILGHEGYEIRGAQTALTDRQRTVDRLLSEPEKDPRWEILVGGQKRSDLPVTRTRTIQMETEDGNIPVEKKTVEKNGSYKEWLEEQRQKDPSGTRYLEALADRQSSERRSAAAVTKRDLQAAEEQLAETAKTNGSEEKKLETAFWQKFAKEGGYSLSGEDLAQSAAKIRGALSELSGYSEGALPLGSSRSENQRTLATNSLIERRKQVLSGLEAAGMPRAMAEGTLNNLLKAREEQVAELDTKFLAERKKAESADLSVGAFSLVPKSPVDFDRVLDLAKKLQGFSGRGYANNVVDQALTAQNFGGVFQMTPEVAVRITSSGPQYVSPTELKKEYQQHVDRLTQLDNEAEARRLRPSVFSEQTKRVVEESLREREEIAKKLMTAGNLTLDYAGTQATAFHIRQRVLSGLGGQDYTQSILANAYSRQQENAMISTTAKTGVALAAIPFTGGTSLLAVTAAGASWGYLTAVAGQGVAHEWQRSIGRDPYWNWVELDERASRAAVQGALTAGVGRGLSALKWSERAASYGGVVGAGTVTSLAYGDSLGEALKNMATQAVLTRIGPQSLSRSFGSTRLPIVVGEAYLTNFLPSAAIDGLRSFVNGGEFQSVTGEKFSFKKDPVAAFGAIVAENLAADVVIGTGRSVRQVRQIVDSRVGSRVLADPSSASKLLESERGRAQLERSLTTITTSDLIQLARNSKTPIEIQGLAQKGLISRSLADIERVSTEAPSSRGAFKKAWDRVVGLFNRPPPTSSNQLKPLRLTGPGSVEPKKPLTLPGPTSSPRASPESASDAFQSAIAAGKTPQQAVNELRTRGFSIPSIEEAQNTYLDLIAKGKVPDITAPASVKSSDFALRRDDARKKAKAYFKSEVQSKPLQELKTLLERAKEFGLFGYVAERVEARIALQTQITETLKNDLRLADDPSKKMAEAIIRAPLGQELLNGVAGRSASEIETQIRSRLRAELGTKTRLPEPAVKNLAQAFEDYLAPGQSNGPRPWPSDRGFEVIDNSQGKVEGNLKEAPKFVTLNTEGMKNTDGVAQVLKQQVEAGAKIIVLQEVPDLKTLQKVMAEAGMGSFSTHLTKEGNQRLAILASSEIAMDRDKGEVGKGAGGKPFYTKTELDLGRSSDGDSQKLVVFGVHLKAFDDPESYQLRQEQLSKLRGAVEAESARSGGRVLVLGDFNLVGSRENNASRSRSKEVEATVRAFEELGLTRMQFENPKGGRPTNRWRNAGARTLDFVFVGKGLAPEGGLRVTNGMGAAELPGGVVNPKKASDHSGIEGSLTVLKPQYQSPKPSGVSSESDAAPTPAPKLSTTDFGKDSYQRVQTQMKKQIDAWIREAEASGQTKRAEVLRSHQDHVNAMVKYVDEHYRQLVADGYNPERLKAAILTHDIGKFVDADPLVAQRHTLRIFQDVKSEKAIQFLRETKGMSKADAEAFLERVRSTPGNRPKAVLSQLSEVDQKIITEAATNPKARNFFAEFMDHAETSREWMRKNPFGGALGKPDEVTRQMMLDSYGHDGPAIPGSWWGANYKSVTGRNYARVWTETGELLRGYDRANQSHLDWAGQQLGGGPRKIAIQVLGGADTPEAHVKAIREGLTSVPKGTQVQLDSLKSEGKIPGYIADQIQKSITDVELLRANTVFYGEKGLAPQGAPEGGIGHVKVGDEIVYFRNTDEFFGTEKKVGAAGRFWKSEIQSQPASKAGITPVTPRPPPESLAVPAERPSPLLDQLAAKVLGAAGPTRSSPRPSEDLPDTQLRPGEETSLSPKQQKQLQKMQRQISRWFVDDVHQLREAYRRIGQEVPDWLADKKVVGKMVDLFNSITEKRGTIPPRDEVGVILQRENDLQELMKRGVPYAVAYRFLDLASGVWTAYNGKNAFPAEVEGQRGTQLHKLPGIISAELEAQGVRFRELSFEQQQRKVEAVLQKLFPGDKALAHLRSPFQVQDEQSNWGPLDKTVEYIVSKAYAVTYGGEPSLSHTTRYRTVPVDPAKVLGPDGAVNRQAVEEILGRQQKETVVHTAQNPQEGIKFVQENAQKKGQTTLPLVIKFLSGLETDVLVGSGPALERVIRAWGPGAAANDSVVRFPKNFEVGEMVVRKNAQGQYLEVTVAPKGPSSATPKSPLRK